MTSIRELVGGEGFEPSSSRSRTVVALGSVRAARDRLGSSRPVLEFARCHFVTAEAAWVATCVATRHSVSFSSGEVITVAHWVERERAPARNRAANRPRDARERSVHVPYEGDAQSPPKLNCALRIGGTRTTSSLPRSHVDLRHHIDRSPAGGFNHPARRGRLV